MCHSQQNYFTLSQRLASFDANKSVFPDEILIVMV